MTTPKPIKTTASGSSGSPRIMIRKEQLDTKVAETLNVASIDSRNISSSTSSSGMNDSNSKLQQRTLLLLQPSQSPSQQQQSTATTTPNSKDDPQQATTMKSSLRDTTRLVRSLNQLKKLRNDKIRQQQQSTITTSSTTSSRGAGKLKPNNNKTPQVQTILQSIHEKQHQK